jgi:hypothetical protein
MVAIGYFGEISGLRPARRKAIRTVISLAKPISGNPISRESTSALASIGLKGE